MVKFYQHTYKYDYPWDSVTLAFWLRYPNPFASHVLSVDVIDRHVDQKTRTLRTTRLILKWGGLSVLPKWGRGLVKNPIALVLEESEINPHTQTMTTLTRNITHARMMQVEEWQTFRVDPNDSGKTQVKSEARIISKLGWGLTEKIERFGVRKFADNTKKSRMGMSHVLEMIRENKFGGGFMPGAR